MTINERIGERLARYRSRAGLTQEELATELSLSRGYISDLERGTRTVSVSTLANICKRTGLKPAALLGV